MIFELNEVEVKAWKEFDKKHQETCSQYTGAVGVSPVETVFVSTSIGKDIFVRCRKCGKQENITDLESW